MRKPRLAATSCIRGNRVTFAHRVLSRGNMRGAAVASLVSAIALGSLSLHCNGSSETGGPGESCNPSDAVGGGPWCNDGLQCDYESNTCATDSYVGGGVSTGCTVAPQSPRCTTCTHRSETDPFAARKLTHPAPTPRLRRGEDAEDGSGSCGASQSAGRGSGNPSGGARDGDRAQHGEAVPGAAGSGARGEGASGAAGLANGGGAVGGASDGVAAVDGG